MFSIVVFTIEIVGGSSVLTTIVEFKTWGHDSTLRVAFGFNMRVLFDKTKSPLNVTSALEFTSINEPELKFVVPTRSSS